MQEMWVPWVSKIPWRRKWQKKKKKKKKKETASRYSILAWEIPWTEKPGELQSIGMQRVGTTETTLHAHLKSKTILREIPFFK